ncbi:hypothetical protein BH24ACT26_BH24ACT26_16540 [soil metagenome]
MYARRTLGRRNREWFDTLYERGEQRLSSHDGQWYAPHEDDRLTQIRQRLVEARRELDALIGDAYLRPRANIVPVHFLDLASAVEKLRWAEKEWRELDQERAEAERELDQERVDAGRERAEPLVEVGRSRASR